MNPVNPKYLCTWNEDRDGGVWSTPRSEWWCADDDEDRPSRWSAPINHVEAAERFVEACWDNDGDAQRPQEVAVECTFTGQRWIVTVTGDYSVEWTGGVESGQRPYPPTSHLALVYPRVLHRMRRRASLVHGLWASRRRA